jgi:tRNA-Thr(GGU) m(6)t(6)A37 methyltransferase TsaA
MSDQKFAIEPVGYVRQANGQFYLEILPQFKDALIGLTGFSHVQVQCWFHLFDSPEYRSIVINNKPYKKAPKKLGVFATRSPFRPNPIALTVLPIMAIDQENGIIEIAYTDADDGTPIIDIKPYHPATDRVKNVSVPEWCAHWPKFYEDNADFDWHNEFVNAE